MTAVGCGFAGLLVVVALCGCSDDAAGVTGAAVDTGLSDTGAVVDVGAGDQAEPIETVAVGADCTGRSDGAACNDGDPCTTGDACLGQQCKGTDQCECKTDSECNVGVSDLCLGKPVCATGTLPYKCIMQMGSKVVCKGQTGPCKHEACNPENGDCEVGAFAEGTKCDDGDPCTVDGICTGGKCAGENATWCECKATADCAVFGDGNS